jgi:flagellar biosynthesis/type III secretory pathway M-ring protein FliF/YscJ
MAQKKKQRRSRGRTLLFYIIFPLIVWFVAFLVWFYWYDLRHLLVKNQEPKARPQAARQVDKSDKAERSPAKRSQEKIFDEERKKLGDIIERQK